MKLLHAVLVVAVLLTSFVLFAQEQEEDAAAIVKLKQTKVATIEAGLPDVTFEQWFVGIAGSNSTIAYEVNDCGERAGTPDEKGKSFPLCVEARAEAGTGIGLVLSLAVGTFIAEPSAKPDLKNPTQFFSGAIVKNDNPVSDIKALSAVPAAWKAATSPKVQKKK
jgi:hypothetical protein